MDPKQQREGQLCVFLCFFKIYHAVFLFSILSKNGNHIYDVVNLVCSFSYLSLVVLDIQIFIQYTTTHSCCLPEIVFFSTRVICCCFMYWLQFFPCNTCSSQGSIWSIFSLFFGCNVALLTLFIANLHVTKEFSDFWNGEDTE